MARRGGMATLPLHGGRVPEWLSSRMAALGRVIVEAVMLHYGRDEVLARLAHPFWFQSFGAVMGMDWHSSGITTSVLAALKRGLGPVEREWGIHVCGGRGKQSRRTPDELRAVGERTGLDGDALAYTSRLVAKVDGAAVQDGYQLYLHGFVVADDGKWVVVQQGMSDATSTARRYHWRSDQVRSFVDEPHAAIDGEPGAEIVNLVDARAARSRAAQVDIVQAGPDGALRVLRQVRARASEPAPAAEPIAATLPHLIMPARHEVRAEDVVDRRLRAALTAAADRGPADFESLLMTPGVGARTVFSLALVAEVIHGAPYRFSDPARFSLAHGGKDGHPYAVPLRVYDETLHVLRGAIAQAKLGREETLSALRRLDEQARRVDGTAKSEGAAEPGALFDALVREERGRRAALGGRTVADDRPRRRRPPAARQDQLTLPLTGR